MNNMVLGGAILISCAFIYHATSEQDEAHESNVEAVHTPRYPEASAPIYHLMDTALLNKHDVMDSKTRVLPRHMPSYVPIDYGFENIPQNMSGERLLRLKK